MKLNEVNGEYERVLKVVKDMRIDDTVKVNPDGTVNITGRTYLTGQNIHNAEKIPFDIMTCDGDLSMHSNTGLTTLKGCPLHVKGDFDVDDCPKLTSFEHAPRKIDGDASFYKCKITSMKFAPTFVGGELDIMRNEITSIEDMPNMTVLSHIDMRRNKIKSFKGIGSKLKCNGEIDISGNPVESHVLGFILIEGLEAVKFDHYEGGQSSTKEVEQMRIALKIVNKYLGKGKAGVLKAQGEMEELDLDDFAQL